MMIGMLELINKIGSLPLEISIIDRIRYSHTYTIPILILIHIWFKDNRYKLENQLLEPFTESYHFHPKTFLGTTDSLSEKGK